MGKYREPDIRLTMEEIETWTPQFSPHLVKSAFFTEALRRALHTVNGSHAGDSEEHGSAVVEQTLLNINEYQ
jgi:hypothetical protein